MAWTFVQSKTGSPGGATSFGIAFTSNVTAGSTLICVYPGGGSTDATTITDTLGNVWTQRVLFSGTWAMFEATSASGGANTVTLANGSGLFGAAGIFEFDGGAGGYEANKLNNATGTAVTLASFTTTSGDLLVASIYSPGGTSVSSPSLTDTGVSVNGVSSVFWGTSSGASSSFSATLSFSDTWSAGMVAEKASGGGGGFTAKFRKTLSTVGTGVGRRQGR